MSTTASPYFEMSPQTCMHGVAWALPCAACARPYVPAVTNTTAVVDLSPVLAALVRIEDLLSRLVARSEES